MTLYLVVEFHNDEPQQDGESMHAGFFNDHADIDAFCNHLHHALKMAQGE